MTETKTQEVVDFIAQFADEEGIPTIIGKDWEEMNAKYNKQEIKEGLAGYIGTKFPLFPYRKIDFDEGVKKKFYDLRSKTYNEFIMADAGEVTEKYTDYKYPYRDCGKFVIFYGHYHNDISNFFQQRNRYDCGSHGFPSPSEYWYSPDLLKKMNWTFWRLDNDGITPVTFRSSFRLGAYVATQFKPHVAKTIYDFALSRVRNDDMNVLDFSMGWGDRLAGFYSSRVKNYFGTDPNPNTFRVYREQCKEYEKLLSGEEPTFEDFQVRVGDHFYDAFRCVGNSGKTVTAYNAPAEDILDEFKKNKYDCIFTSPPYFSTELYDEGGDDWKQSWFRYAEYEKWWEDFFKPVLTACYESLTDRGIMMINIMDPQIKTKRFRTCDQMVDHIVELGGKFDGQVGMRIKQRPKDIDTEELKKYLVTTYIENVWCFSKNGFDLSHKPATLESLFGE